MAPDFAQHNRIEMPAEEIDRLLREEGVGVLSLADDGVAYGIPLSFGYDADRGRLYFVFLRPGESSKKAEFAERTARASFTVWNAPSRDQWESVVVDGELRRVDDGDWDRVRDALEDNAWYPTLFSETEPMQDILGWELRIDSRTGLQRRRA
ncbi:MULTISPECIES: pyridoxamine 5'-phosphate oxidase family protein [unclassified Haloferax]|uniref:pyridoxamine 5'-phosphate oxidase family protein n=1 Tax=Haloferax TaxID=2251 RepID=UPI0002AFA9AE|nr:MULTISPECIES: pyridoxamine 5'-phosphate oxidase family protein [unclassified Haloferax]ELZ58154.1 Pyridoxamine 5-phosphate oxidase family protein [Haloferax sp. ATCC BAA-646]ELZ62938.1 Pyridoxamine 5-phosphate oxidase family protein [Haloferax sp. ATCC BAA-645]ELZ63290.1 Pyridoxamine 5-phosphate oxidase family protein [Haloferax sp. ATCC BAA-644]